MPPDPARTLRLASRAMGRHGLAHAYGHVSTRLDDGSFLVSPPQPLGTVTTNEPGVVVPLDGDLPAGALPEVRTHREIYRKRPAIGGVVRVQPPSVMALSALGETPRVHHGLGAYFAPAAPLWPGVALVRDDAQAVQVADMLGDAAAIVLSGNGCVCAAATLEEAACLAFFLEDAARLELAILPARAAGAAPREYTSAEVAARAVKAGGLFERMWHHLCFGDPEWQSIP
ncbi:MAG: class II aldolase/adducin family protein [Sphingomonas sp.]|uniref:class II aldolase/adducin family protein n=1 Tax=Sphingomonas sp. TaxID=28214 RepID=UPI0025CFDBCB|nr:class II aldolase/adducin family protein [Sphingomonas sp.]MBX3563571.1 class II aldolase/adducin family protein [Sphingomonas sp.]